MRKMRETGGEEEEVGEEERVLGRMVEPITVRWSDVPGVPPGKRTEVTIICGTWYSVCNTVIASTKVFISTILTPESHLFTQLATDQ